MPSRFCGGRNRTRTCDPIDVNDVLYQLSHATLSELYWQSLLKMFVLLGELSEASSERLASNPFTSTWHFLTKVPVGTANLVKMSN